MVPTLPLLITTMVISLNVNVDEINFEKNPYSQCQIVKLQVPILNQLSESTVNQYLDRHKPGYEFYLASPRWRVLRYNVSGHIIPHLDKDRPYMHYDHIATEIFIPPTSQVQFEGGQLIVKENKQPRKIMPHPTEWTYVLMPLGFVHEVTNITSGYRISYTKAIYVQKKKQSAQNETLTNSGEL